MPKYISIRTKNGELRLNQQSVRNMLYSKEIEQALIEAAKFIQSRAGNGYDVETYRGHDRVRAAVKTNSNESALDNLNNNTLLKAVGK